MRRILPYFSKFSSVKIGPEETTKKIFFGGFGGSKPLFLFIFYIL